MANRWGNSGNSGWLFFWAPKSRQMIIAAMKLRHLLLGRKVMTSLDSLLKSRDITLPTKVCLVKAMVFPVVMYGCESWPIKKAEPRKIDAFWTVVLEKTLESPLDCKEIQPDRPKGDQPWVFIGRTDAEAETPILWPPDVKNWLTGKDSDAGKDWGKEEKGVTEDETVDGITDSMDMSLGGFRELVMDREAWHAAVRKESNTTEWLNWTEYQTDILFPFLCSFLCILEVYSHPQNYFLLMFSFYLCSLCLYSFLKKSTPPRQYSSLSP